MAKYSRLDVLTTMLQTGLVPLFYHADVEVAFRVVEACAAGGARCIEFANRGDQAHGVFQELVRRFAGHPSVILGIGSVLDPGTASLYLQLGANFVVGPATHAEVARTCNRRKVAYLPGCGSVTEISAAEELGVEICKIFPGGQVGGPAFVKAVLGPMPWARLMPTGGVEATEESVRAWIEAGAACLGIGSKLITKQVLGAGEYNTVTSKVRDVLGWIEAARGK
jgi:2-dehydro-3-deoxyphosphogluconate aldolase/(4S)-4-hydroxy-2-oxoglutarate aldolase